MRYEITRTNILFTPEDNYERGKVKEAMAERQRMINEFLLTPDEARLKKVIMYLIQTSNNIDKTLLENIREYNSYEQLTTNVLFGDRFTADITPITNRLLYLYEEFFNSSVLPFCKDDARVKRWVNEIRVIGYE